LASTTPCATATGTTTTTVASTTTATSASTTTPASSTSPSDTQPPSPPTGVTLANASDRTITLAWSASTDNVSVTGYQLYLNGSSAGTTQSTSYAFTGLNCGTTYTL